MAGVTHLNCKQCNERRSCSREAGDKKGQLDDARHRCLAAFGCTGATDVVVKRGCLVSTGNTLELNLLSFVNLLRHCGFVISSTEILDAIRGLKEVDLLDREAVRAVLQGTLAKRSEQIPLFQRAFQLFFTYPEERDRLIRQKQEKDAARRELLREADRELTFRGQPLHLTDQQRETYARLVPAERSRIKEFLEKSSNGYKVHEGFRPIIETLVAGQLNHWQKQLPEQDTEQDAIPLEPTGDIELDAILEELAAGAPGHKGRSIMYQDLKEISDKDLPRLAVVTQLLAKRLASKISRRYRTSRKRGRIDFRRTIRSNLRYGGTLFQLKYGTKKLQKPRLLLVCDVSGSMTRYTRFVLQFIYGLSSVLERIETFVFSEDLERITPHFQQKKSFEETMAWVVDNSEQWGRGTDLSTSLRTLMANYVRLLLPDTYVIIVSDTKTLSIERSEEDLARMRKRVKDILWLNTVARSEWEGMASVSAFKKHVQMYECYTLAHLEKVVRGEIWG